MIRKHFGLSVFWVSAASRESFVAAYEKIGTLLKIPGLTDDHADITLLVRDNLTSSKYADWVMIVDDANDPNIFFDNKRDGPHSGRLYDCLPRSDRGSILFTTRSKSAAKLFTPDNVLQIEDMKKTDAEHLVARRIWNKTLLEDEHSVKKLFGYLTCLPLAVIQATSFINNKNISISDCISLLQHADTEVQLFREYFHDPTTDTATENTIARTWQISFEQIKRQDPIAAEYLCFMACLNRTSIPLSLLPTDDENGLEREALETLHGYGFVSERQYNSDLTEGERLLDIHPLIQKAARWWLKEHGSWTAWTAKAYRKLKKDICLGEHGERHRWITSLPYTANYSCPCIELSGSGKIALSDQRKGVQDVSDQQAATEATERQVASLNKKNLGDRDILTSHGMDGMTLEFQRTGQSKKVETLYGPISTALEDMLGSERKDTLSDMNNLTQALDLERKHEETEMILRSTMASMHSIIGKKLQSIIESMTSYAILLFKNGKYNEAERMHKRTLEIKKILHRHGNFDPTESMVSSQALGYKDEFEKSDWMGGEKVTFSEKILHSEHLDTPKASKTSLRVMKQPNKQNEAEIISRKTPQITKQALGKVYLDIRQERDDVTDIGCKADIQWREYEVTEIDADTQADLEEGGMHMVKNNWTRWEGIIL